MEQVSSVLNAFVVEGKIYVMPVQLAVNKRKEAATITREDMQHRNLELQLLNKVTKLCLVFHVT